LDYQEQLGFKKFLISSTHAKSGESWGEHGYIRLVRGQNECGLADYVSYPVI
jgi:hypothetical protein